MTDEDRVDILENIKSIAEISYGENSNVSRLARELIESYKRIKPEEEAIDEKAAYLEKVEQANLDGKEIQYKETAYDVWIDRHSLGKNAPLNWSKNEYRIKPESKFIQWTVQTIPKGEPLRYKGWIEGVCFIPHFYGIETIKHSGPNGDNYKSTYKDIFDDCSRLDGSPCGDEVEA